MSESIWWTDEFWWERKALPLGFITLSFRQLITLAVSFLLAFVASLPFQFPIAGVSFGGRATAFCFVLGVGYIISSRRVRLIPAELQALYVLRARLASKFGMGKSPPSWNERSPMVHEIRVDDFKDPIPLVISDKVKGLKNETKALLLVDDRVREVESVSPQNPRFRLTYIPLPEDVGVRLLTVRLEGSSDPLLSLSISIRAGNPGANETISKVG